MPSSSVTCILHVLDIFAVSLVWHSDALHLLNEVPPDAMSRSAIEGLTRSECSSGHVVWWLHIPKCGTSFGEAVSSCEQDPTREPGPNVHPPLPPKSHSVENVVAIFREPSQRLASALTFMGHRLQICGAWGCEKDDEDRIRELHRQGFTPATNDFLGKNFLGCQTNMVLGKMCMAGSPADPVKAAHEAIARVDNFFFVGLLEEWGLSICLFNYFVTGQRFITERQLANTRPTKDKGKAEAYDTSGYPRDVADETLYKYVVQRFNDLVKLHGISREACSFDFDGSPLNVFVAEELFAPGKLLLAE